MQMVFLGVEKLNTNLVSSLEINNREERGMKRFKVRTLQVDLRCLTPANLVTLQKSVWEQHTPQRMQNLPEMKPADFQKFFKHPKRNT